MSSEMDGPRLSSFSGLGTGGGVGLPDTVLSAMDPAVKTKLAELLTVCNNSPGGELPSYDLHVALTWNVRPTAADLTTIGNLAAQLSGTCLTISLPIYPFLRNLY